MVKLRTNHGYSRSGANVARLIIIAGCLIALILYVLKEGTDGILSVDSSSQPVEARFFLPSGGKGQVFHYPDFSYSFIVEESHPEWIAFSLTSTIFDSLHNTSVLEYIPDPNIKDFWLDVDHAAESGYIAECYLPFHLFHQSGNIDAYKPIITMMCPVDTGFHKGLWKEIQFFITQNVERKGELLVVVGPLFTKEKRYFSEYPFPIPDQYFFTILYTAPGEERAIGFILPNTKNYKTLSDYAVTIDSLEVVTGLNFFNQFLEVEQEKSIETEYDFSLWQSDSK